MRIGEAALPFPHLIEASGGRGTVDLGSHPCFLVCVSLRSLSLGDSDIKNQLELCLRGFMSEDRAIRKKWKLGLESKVSV